MNVSTLIQRGALFVVNNSGGKDSQAMLAVVRRLVPAAQILVVHAELPGVEWKGTLEHARAMSEGLEFLVCQAGKTFLGMVEQTGRWPSPKHRQCTSDLKRGPIEKAIRHYVKARGLSGLIVNCMGLRAEESDNRACGLDKKANAQTGEVVTLKLNERNSKAGREWYDWLPIHGFSIEDVWTTIAAAGQSPHWAYAAGMSRLSCCFCIMASKADLRTAAELNPELFASIVALEKKIGKTMFATKAGNVPLDAYVGVKAEGGAA
jgi:DNA sulfur modification protein DndC